MKEKNTKVSANLMTMATATTMAGVAALIWKTVRHKREARAVRVEPPRVVPVWARAAAIVASSIAALLMLVRQER